MDQNYTILEWILLNGEWVRYMWLKNPKNFQVLCFRSGTLSVLSLLWPSLLVLIAEPFLSSPLHTLTVWWDVTSFHTLVPRKGVVLRTWVFISFSLWPCRNCYAETSLPCWTHSPFLDIFTFLITHYCVYMCVQKGEMLASKYCRDCLDKTF